MTRSCEDFRALLELVLEGGAVEQALSELAWHDHLLACGECRNLLQAEEALEILLATLPEPKLPAHLARRVVSRLRDARKADSRLDALLELDRAAETPDRLAESVLARLRPERERSAETTLAAAAAKLERLLDLDRDVIAPTGLAERVLAGLRAERARARPTQEPARAETDPVRAHAREEIVHEGARRNLARVQPSFADGQAQLDIGRRSAQRGRTFRVRSPLLYAAAAGILATFIGWVVWQRVQFTARGDAGGVAQGNTPTSSNDGRSQPANSSTSEDRRDKTAQHTRGGDLPRDGEKLSQHDPNAPPEAGMLAALDVLEQWDLLKSDDVDVLLSSSIDPADEVLLEYLDTESTNPPFNDKEVEPPHKG